MKKTMHFPLILEQDEDGIYIISCNSFKGSHAQGKTIDEAMDNIKEVISMCMEEEEELDSMNQFVGFRELEIVI
jgi:predicted RNase H-like HicB family nuclease